MRSFSKRRKNLTEKYFQEKTLGKIGQTIFPRCICPIVRFYFLFGLFIQLNNRTLLKNGYFNHPHYFKQKIIKKIDDREIGQTICPISP